MSDPLPIRKVADIEERPEGPEWLIHSLWGKAAVGIIGGHPKCGKSHLGLDMAVSVASKTPCLGHFPVEDPGLSLVFLAEDALPLIRARTAAICQRRNLAIERLDLHVITAPGLRLDTERDQRRLRDALENLRPRFLLLDPMVRLHRLDENSATEISGLLGFLRELNRSHSCAVALVHHASKKRRAVPGQALRGSSDIYAWGDSLAYLRRRKRTRITLTAEHRAAPAPDPVSLELVPAEGASHLRVVTHRTPRKKPSLTARLQAILCEANGPMTRTALRAELRIRNQRLGDLLTRLEDAGRLRRTAQGWTLNDPPPMTSEPGGVTPTGS